ncbi:hypothetical protein JKP88DRAFT_231474 [Tribonema minus]|uniref:Uncharacterized protein n=1 Tax=Tribonema minus TaxID=303371 RepID=A0A836CLN5_9STRA|nr:hypothetical protein JKP88DRAFT_231474 [Tribonema minus]
MKLSAAGLLLCSSGAAALATGAWRNGACAKPAHAPAAGLVSRRDVFAGIASSVAAVGFAGAAVAKDDPSKVGTKDDPKFQACISQCIYECTKPKGSMTRSRGECLPECKKNCATTKAQAMTGVPK